MKESLSKSYLCSSCFSLLFAGTELACIRIHVQVCHWKYHLHREHISTCGGFCRVPDQAVVKPL